MFHWIARLCQEKRPAFCVTRNLRAARTLRTRFDRFSNIGTKAGLHSGKLKIKTDFLKPLSSACSSSAARYLCSVCVWGGGAVCWTDGEPPIRQCTHGWTPAPVGRRTVATLCCQNIIYSPILGVICVLGDVCFLGSQRILHFPQRIINYTFLRMRGKCSILRGSPYIRPEYKEQNLYVDGMSVSFYL